MFDCRAEPPPLIPDFTNEPQFGKGSDPSGDGSHKSGTINNPVPAHPSADPVHEITISIGVGTRKIGGDPGVILSEDLGNRSTAPDSPSH